MNGSILQVKNLKAYFYTSGGIVKAVDDVSFDVRKGETFGLVGESGSGKTMLALSILKIVPQSGRIIGGKILYNGKDLLKIEEDSLRNIRGAKIAIVFQEPASALNPVFTIGDQIMESVLTHQRLKDRHSIEKLALEYLDKVHAPNPKKIFYDYPHQLSGGMKQRVMIAMALVNSPEFLILDEPTTALDVTIQAQILDLLDEIIEEEKLSVLFISHDFGIIGRMCDRVAVMYKGRIVELGETDQILHSPKEPYTMSLLESVKALS
ncbi:MAG: ABC transporter ATP-binding protein [Candidatus Omnitrophica bacterium]|nr:ABC transporter ATP-binding protein [Candidatus Omnitrophota bacterium]